jgi:hypothetical protein
VKKVLYKRSSEIYIIKRKMIGIRTVLKTLALICLVNLTFIRAEEATATVENKVDSIAEAPQAADSTAAGDNNLRFLASCVDRACAVNAQCCPGYWCNLNACLKA